MLLSIPVRLEKELSHKRSDIFQGQAVKTTSRGGLRGPLAVALAAGIFSQLSSIAAESRSHARPNILFIIADDHAAHALSCYGSRINQTPNLDRLANEGMRFLNCFAVNSICTPSRAAILTGKCSHINGVTVFNRFDGRQPTVAKMLRSAGLCACCQGAEDRAGALAPRIERSRPVRRRTTQLTAVMPQAASVVSREYYTYFTQVV